MAQPRRLGVLGSPIAHSRSPRIHAAAYAALGLDWEYGRHELGEAELAGFLAGRDASWLGLSLTMPLKTEAHRLAARLDPVASRSGVVNTLLREPGHPERWAGWNTDVFGLVRAIEAAAGAGARFPRVAVLGAGATAVSALLAAEQLGAREISVLARRPNAVQALFAGLPQPGIARRGARLAGPSLDPSTDLVISTLPGDAGAEFAAAQELRASARLFDVAYSPWPSPLAASWAEAGGAADSGVEMLLWQALAQVRIFLGGDPEVPLPDEDRVLGAMRLAGVGE